jgi:hypothetical protein
MTMHEHQTQSTGSYDQSQDAPAETLPDRERADAPDASTAEPMEPPAEASFPDEAAPPAEDSSAQDRSSAPDMLFADEELAELRARWAGVQAAFVDDPKDCVQKADVLVSDLVEQLTDGFAHARSRLEEQWARGEQASTEDLRVALMHYREFFERLLAV